MTVEHTSEISRASYLIIILRLYVCQELITSILIFNSCIMHLAIIDVLFTKQSKYLVWVMHVVLLMSC